MTKDILYKIEKEAASDRVQVLATIKVSIDNPIVVNNDNIQNETPNFKSPMPIFLSNLNKGKRKSILCLL